MPDLHDVIIIVPTLNAGSGWNLWIDGYLGLSPRPDCLVVDSSSNDKTVPTAARHDIQVRVIDRASFDHGGTRNIALQMKGRKFIVFMTQDAVAADSNAVTELLKPFSDEKVAAVYGRQLPRKDADVFGAFARLRNYPSESYIRSYEDRKRFGLKTAFISNSFSAYRRSVLDSMGGFPEGLIFGEDMYMAAKMLKAGWKVAYAADACVVHSHDYTALQEFRRYFDMGVLHAEAQWIRLEFGSAEKEGVGYVSEELKYVLKHAFWRLPESIMRTALKFLGFRLGLLHQRLPLSLKSRLGMNPGYFKY